MSNFISAHIVLLITSAPKVLTDWTCITGNPDNADIVVMCAFKSEKQKCRSFLVGKLNYLCPLQHTSCCKTWNARKHRVGWERKKRVKVRKTLGWINLGPWLGNSEHVSGLSVAAAAAATIFVCQVLFPQSFELRRCCCLLLYSSLILETQIWFSKILEKFGYGSLILPQEQFGS